LTAAVLVVYGVAVDLSPQLARLHNAAGRVIVVDNNEQASPALAQLAAGALPLEVLVNGNRGGLAGAYNRALQRLHEDANPPAQVVFVDQDSDPAVLTALLADPEVVALLARSDVAAIAPAYRDRATGLRGRYIELGRWRMRHLPREFDGLRRVAFVINSMTIWRHAALLRLGAFDETLALDHVDTEHCLRARTLGLSVWVHGSHVFAHAIGQRRSYRLFGRTLQATGHGPARRRLLARNTVLLLRRWGLREPAFARLCLLRLAYEAVGIVRAEEERLPRLAALARGAFDGLWRRART
jgi:rhamnosyltransferase